MNEGEIEQIRHNLIRLKVELQELSESFKETSQPVQLDQSSIGRLSRMDAMQTQQMALEVARRREHQLLKIEGTLRRIESGEFGYCFKCGEELDTLRLSIEPTTTRCKTCVEK